MRLERGQPPSKWIVGVVVALAVVSFVIAQIGDIYSSLWFDRHPARLIAMTPADRILVLTTIHLDSPTFYTVAFSRMLSSDPLYYLIGYWYGKRAIAWIERRSKTYGPLIRDSEDSARRLAYPLVFISPVTFVCALAGAVGMRVVPFLILNVTGTIGRLVLIRQLGVRFEGPLQSVGDFIAQYRIQFLVISVIIAAWSIYNEFFSGDGDTQSLIELAREEDEGAGSDVEDTVESDG